MYNVILRPIQKITFMYNYKKINVDIEHLTSHHNRGNTCMYISQGCAVNEFIRSMINTHYYSIQWTSSRPGCNKIVTRYCL